MKGTSADIPGGTAGRRPGTAKRLAAAAAWLACAGALLCALCCASLHRFLRGGEPPPTFRAVREAHRPSEGLLLDRHGAPLQEVRADFRERVLPWAPLAEISPALVAAVLRSEDKRFFRHPGVDGIALLSAAAEAAGGGRPRGASTITMQLADLLDEGTGSPGGAGGEDGRAVRDGWSGAGGRGGRRDGRGMRGRLPAKLAQTRAALLLERRWTKQEILEAYLNRVPFRGELRGIAAAARGIFDKEPGGLDAAESALLASLIRSPNAPPSAVARRAARLCADLGWDVPPTALAAKAADRLRAPFPVRFRYAIAPHAARILSPGAGERVVSTLDAALQEFAADALARQIAALSGRNVADAAALVVENATGEILAYVGSGGPASKSPLVDGVRARRQAGSTLKPFLYGAAFERRLLTPASLLSDSPLDVPTERGLYAPQNYDRGFRGLVTAREALASSLNVPAVRTVLLLGPDAMARRLEELGFGLPGTGEDYGASLALGSADVTLYELVNAYRALANGGRWSPMTLRREEAPAGGRGTPRAAARRAAMQGAAARGAMARRAMGREATFLVSDILSDRAARGEAFGLVNPLATPFWSAVKTGTSKDMRDNWCVGYSDRYTVGVWAGNFSGEPMRDVSGVSGAAPAWAEIMARLHEGRPGRAPAPPPGVVRRRVTFAAGPGGGRDEWFLAGTEPPAGRVAAAGRLPAAIRYPVEGEVVALDPDIPEGRQLLFLEAEGGEGLSWRLDGAPAGPADAPLPWRPVAGSHVLSLVGRDGETVETVSFQVRGSASAERRAPATTSAAP
jgi:penicillin-binding protein 1C